MVSHLENFFRQSKIKRTDSSEKVFIFLEDPINVMKMKLASDHNLPALSFLASELEEKFVGLKDFDLANHFPRQNVGRMTKYIMNLYGYTVRESGLNDNNHLRKFSAANYFKTSAVYHKTNKATFDLVCEQKKTNTCPTSSLN